MKMFRIVAFGVHGLKRLTSGRRIGRLLSHLFDLGGAYLGASGQSNKTSDETRCVKIAWHSGILLIHSFVKLCLQKGLYRHIEVVDACRWCVRRVCGHIQFYSCQHSFVDHTPQAQPFQLETINFNLETHWVNTGFVFAD